MKRALTCLLVIAFALSAGACNNSSSKTSSGDAKPAKSDGKIRIKATEYSFEPSVLHAKPGKIVLTIQNIGSAVHEFEVFKGRKLVGEVEDIAPGLELALTLTLAKGTYEYACKLEDHYERGMKGRLRVE
jgi:iron uptake system component EfeO